MYLQLTFSSLLLLLGLGIVAGGCRSSIEVTTKQNSKKEGDQSIRPGDDMGQDKKNEDVPKNEDERTAGKTEDSEDGQGRPDPVELFNKLTLKDSKNWFQSRNTITIRIEREVLESAGTYAIYNITDPDNPVTVVEPGTVAELGLSLFGGFSLAESQVDSEYYILHFYPGEDRKGKFFYGENLLRLDIDDGLKFADLTLWVKDFPVFDIAVTSFATNHQVANLGGPEGYQFQGWVNVLSPATVVLDEGAGALTHGMFNMINP